MPGVAAYALAVNSNIATAKVSPKSICVFEIVFFMFIALMAQLLINVDFGHQPTEVLRVVRQMVKVGGVEVVRSCGNTGAIENHVERFTTREGDGVGRVIQIVACLVAEQLGVVADDLHRDSE